MIGWGECGGGDDTSLKFRCVYLGVYVVVFQRVDLLGNEQKMVLLYFDTTQ